MAVQAKIVFDITAMLGQDYMYIDSDFNGYTWKMSKLKIRFYGF
jgi:hypothetical protein